MEEIKELIDAWEGDLTIYKDKIYRVVNTDIIEAGHVKKLRVVKSNPLLPITFVKTIYVDKYSN